MEEHKVIADDGRVLWAAELGHGEPLVLCQGDPGPRDVFDGLAELLADRVRVIRWDPRDDSRSAPDAPDATARAVADLDAVRSHFGLPEAALLGHSRGVDTALRYALAHPDRVSSLVCVPGGGPDRDDRELLARCRGLTVPTLIVDGTADARSRCAADSLAEALPDVARVVLPGAGHVPWVESPGSFGWAVLAHLEQ
ncbi:alpha/beta hydrolase family protein [Saccharothrix carnea]|uniref:Alpha/beta hydrolase family protein n=1 Tax=Saccharothrix carnea TaxID=1280637 RepID=A0A2P8I3M6_SACCR|nr:alpha/beta fold hydrolase [Saccharothrix carnea]PSL53063.1 alpha/beta hydrolase family protein [Saccharothrix carnea]